MAIKSNHLLASIKRVFNSNVISTGQALNGGLQFAGLVITDDISAAGVNVGKGNIVRVKFGATAYVSFSDDSSIDTVSVTTSPGIMLDANTWYYIIASADYIRASSAATRMELIFT